MSKSKGTLHQNISKKLPKYMSECNPLLPTSAVGVLKKSNRL